MIIIMFLGISKNFAETFFFLTSDSFSGWSSFSSSLSLKVEAKLNETTPEIKILKPFYKLQKNF